MYQVGALKAICEVASKKGISQPFSIITGSSAGSINAAFMASYAHQIASKIQMLVKLWSELSTQHVFHVSSPSLMKIGFRWMMELSMGSFIKKKQALSLLNTEPLGALLKEHLSFDNIQKNIDDHVLHAMAIKVLNYSSGIGQTFFHGPESISTWKRSGRQGERTTIQLEHVLASSAIPILFPPVRIGDEYFGDGSLRNYTPLSPAIKLGAEKLLVIGSKHVSSQIQPQFPSLARQAGLVLNSVLIDAIDLDYERLLRINETVRVLEKEKLESSLKPIDVLLVRPSQDIGHIAAEEMSKMPLILRHLIKGLGSEKQASDLISYLLFESSFTIRLIDLGYEDVLAQESELQNFLDR